MISWISSLFTRNNVSTKKRKRHVFMDDTMRSIMMDMRRDGYEIKTIATTLGVSYSTAARHIRKEEKQNG